MFGAEPYQFEPTYPPDKNQHNMEKEKKEALHPNLQEYGLVCLKEMYFYDERRRVLSNFADQGFCCVL